LFCFYSNLIQFQLTLINLKESSDSEESKSPDPFDSGKLPSNSNNDQLTSKQKQRLLQLHKVLGDSVFLIERLRNHPLAQNQFMSPLLSDNSTLAKFPSTYLIVSNFYYL